MELSLTLFALDWLDGADVHHSQLTGELLGLLSLGWPFLWRCLTHLMLSLIRVAIGVDVEKRGLVVLKSRSSLLYRI